MTCTFASIPLRECKYTPLPKPQVNSARLTSGKKKLQTSTSLDYSFKISCMCSAAEKAVLLATLGTFGTLILDGITHTNCVIKSWDEDEFNPNTYQVKLTFEKDTSL